MPRNVVTLSPRVLALLRRSKRRRIEAELAKHYRFRRVQDDIAIDFSKRHGDARSEVVATLDAIEPGWRRLFVMYGRD